MMYEVLKRRYAKSRKATGPDLLVVDGGKGSSTWPWPFLRNRSDGISAIGWPRRERRVRIPGKSADKIYLPNVKDRSSSRPTRFLCATAENPRRSAPLSIAFHKKLRASRPADDPGRDPGIGEIKKKALLRHFGSLPRIEEASVEALSESRA